MTSNINNWPTDPEGSEAPTVVKKKRTRRSRTQIDADDAAIALGFKNAADQAASRPQMKEDTPPKDTTQEVFTHPDNSEMTSTDGIEWTCKAPIIDLRKVHDLTPDRTMTGLSEGTRWNLGGRAFVLDQVMNDGKIIFRPV